ncbi:MAG TPA: DUF1616 domain-containing protein [Solirubrobacteraceae bacterium]
MRLREGAVRSDMAVVSALALLSCLICAVAPSGLAPIRVPLALPLVLVLPGYASVTALFAPDTLRAPERIMLSLSLSIVASILTGLAVDIAGFRLWAAPWIELLAAVTLIATATAFARGHESPLSLPHQLPGPRLRPHELLALLVALVLLVAAAAIGFRPLAPPAETQGTVALGLLEAPGGAAGVCVSVVNEEFHASSYRVVVSVAGRGPHTLTTTKLAPGASWNREVAVGAGFPDVRATLYRPSAPSRAYRNTSLVNWPPYLRAKRC